MTRAKKVEKICNANSRIKEGKLKRFGLRWYNVGWGYEKMERNNRGIKYKELKTVGKNFSKICKNYSKEKISRVVPVNIILSPFPYGFHPYNGEMHEGDLRVSLKGTQARKRERERRRERIVGRGERRRLDSKEQSFARSNERSLIRV